MSLMVEGKMPHMYIETESSIAKFMGLCSGNESVNMFVARGKSVSGEMCGIAMDENMVESGCMMDYVHNFVITLL